MSRALCAVLALLCAPAAPSSAKLTVSPRYADVRGGQPLVLTLATGTHWHLEQPHCLIGTPAALNRAYAVPLPCHCTGSALPPAHRAHLRHRVACTGGASLRLRCRTYPLPCGTGGGNMGRRPLLAPAPVMPTEKGALLRCPHTCHLSRRGDARTPPVPVPYPYLYCHLSPVTTTRHHAVWAPQAIRGWRPCRSRAARSSHARRCRRRTSRQAPSPSRPTWPPVLTRALSAGPPAPGLHVLPRAPTMPSPNY